ncbi:hypothetical protein Paz_14 [Xylella phage Paz]|uniref:Uncharacterized protein n=1 Tax=Xylella phage Paz TaxID=1415145 RepID=V5Q8J4_9CAUD|nr:hypothetical protein Paz_14 [Xylella phage Paz]AHB12111.1 hypothetical protein Paz_14 [Xylella phage Paz]
MLYERNVVGSMVGAVANRMLKDCDGVVIAKAKTPTGRYTGAFHVQALGEAPDARIPKYTIATICPPSTYPKWPKQYAVKRTEYGGRVTTVARFSKEADANEYLKLRNERAHTEVKDRYKMERRGPWLCIIDAEAPAAKFAIAKFASSHEVTAAAFLQRLNRG